MNTTPDDETFGENPCAGCGGTDMPLHTDGRCPNCHTPADERYPVFVYGTLRPCWWNARLWEGRATPTHDGTAILLGYKLVRTAFPYAVPAATAQTVGTLIVPHPHLYDEVLADMDVLEGVRSGHYDRIRVAVLTEAEPCFAWVYVPARIDRRIGTLPEVATVDGRYDWNAERSEMSR
jgi:gamma-glutamylcyclotransferase (GGCT)/AIG2-like uncharacterized protein YtfP